MDDLAYLFEDVHWHTGSAKFERRTEPPPDALISNINIVPYIGDQWVVVRLRDGHYETPGGTLEAGEHYLDALRRELMEEAGAEMVSFTPLGAWYCTSTAAAPYRPHLPHPNFYRFVGYGEVKLVAAPTNPDGAEMVAAVETLPLQDAVRCFEASGRPELADLYRLAARVRREADTR